MKHRARATIATIALAAAGVLSSRPALACGGFFCSQQQPVNQAAERIIFADNGDGTITAVIQILYEGPSESFSWLLPIGSVPEGDELGVASDIAFTRLQFATNPSFNLNTIVEGECRRPRDFGFAVESDTADGSNVVPGTAGPAVNDSGVNVEASGIVGAFEWTVISVDAGVPDPATPATTWLTQNGYDIPPGSAQLIGPYLADDMYLLALRLTKGSDSGSIRPIRLTYEASAPMIPIKLTAVAANRDMGVMTWALSNARAVPFNYNALELNEARINWFNAASNYDAVVTAAADDAGGQGFVTEFAGPSRLLADVVWSASDEAEWRTLQLGTYSAFDDIFATVAGRYQSFSGFWDAIRRTVTLPAQVPFADFQSCPSCYSEQVQFSPTELFAAIEADVIEPVRSVQELIDGAPYTTRLYSTLSAAEMTVDPVFVFNADLPDVDNAHSADRIVECSLNLFEFEAPWRIEFPQGTTIRGTAEQVGQWPAAVDEQPPNFRVLTLAASGEGAVVDDNAATIGAMLDDYNDSVPTPKGSLDSGGFCNIAGGAPGSRNGALGGFAWVALGVGALLARGRHSGETRNTQRHRRVPAGRHRRCQQAG